MGKKKIKEQKIILAKCSFIHLPLLHVINTGENYLDQTLTMDHQKNNFFICPSELPYIVVD